MMNYCCSAAVLLLMVVAVQGQITGPARPTAGVRLFLQELDSPDEYEVANFTVLHAGLFRNSQDDIFWCQSANNNNPIGDWYFPNGSQVMTTNSNFHVLPLEGQIGLLRNTGIGAAVGLYRCVVPDENDVNQTLWAGIYSNGAYDDASKLNFMIENPMVFSLVSSSRDTDPPVFTLSFNVTNVPPQTVKCFVDNTVMVDIEYLDRQVIIAEDAVRVLVTVTINSRQNGSYHCVVNASSAGSMVTSTDSLDITVTGIPTNLIVSRPGFQQAIISWSPPVSNDPIVQGYEVFYDSPNGTRLSIAVGDNTMTTIKNLDPELNYTVFVVAYGGDLPSAASDKSNISEALLAFSIDVPAQSMLQFEDMDIIITCTIDVNIELSMSAVLQLAWFLNEVLNSTQMVVTMSTVSLDLTLGVVNVTDAGVYSCGAMLTDSFGVIVNVSSTDHTVTVQLPSPTVSINIGPGTSYNRTFITGVSNIFCNAEVPSGIGIPVTPSFTWWGPEGQIMEGDKYDILSDIDMENNINISHLVINNLEDTDNLTMYYCSVQLSIDTSVPPESYTDYTIPSAETTSDNVTISFEELPVPSVTVVPVDAPLIGSNFSIMCIATFDETVANVTTYQWRVNGSVLFRNGVSFSDDNSTLTVTNVSVSDEEAYTCIATLDIIEILTDTTANATYDVLTFDNPVVVITTDGSIIAGSVYTLTCTVTVVTGVPNITWSDPDGNIVNDSLNSNTELVLVFSSLNFTDIGEYICSADLSIPELNFLGMGSNSITVDVQIPTPNVTITTDTADTFIRGTMRYITCNVTLNPPLPMDINVTLDWRKDGVPFDNSTDRVIESSVQQNGNTFSSTITFSPLNTTDEGNYECIGIVNPETSDDNIIGSSNNGSLSLTVNDISNANINVNISASGTGVINDGYSLTCTVSIADNLIGFFANLTLEKMTDNGYQVLDYSTGTTITVDLSPLTTVDAGMYKCSYDIRQDVINYQMIFENFMNITVTIPPPVVQVTTDPDNLGTLIEGTYIDLVCNSSINEGVDTDISVTVVWSEGSDILTNGTGYSISNVELVSGYYISIVRIEELEVTNNAVYTCTVTATPLISTFITENNGNNDITISVRDFVTSDVTVAITFSSVPTAGDQFNVTCSATVPERLIYSPLIVISYDFGSQELVAEDNPNATQSAISRDDNIFSRIVTIDPVKTSDARRYFCIVSFEEPLFVIVTDTNDLEVQITPPFLSISLTPSGIIYESTILVITCNGTLPSAVDTDVTTTVTWTGPNGIINSDERIMVVSVGDNYLFQSLLTFQPVDNGDMNNETNDEGMYTCEMTISSTESEILSSVNSITGDFNITDLPDLEVTISTSGSTVVGQSLNITCSVVLIEGLVSNISIELDKMDAISKIDDLNLLTVTTVDNGMAMVTLILDPVEFNHRGVYICKAEYSVTVTNDEESRSVSTNLTVDFPPFDVAISQDYNDPLYTGTNLTITCSITLDSLVDIPVIVNNIWTRNGSVITENTITENLITNSNISYTATLEFFPLYSLTDDGEYQCSVALYPDVSDDYVADASSSASTSIDVLDLPNPVVTVSRSSLNPGIGESFEFVCNVSVVDRLIVSPEITWNKYVSSDNNSLSEDDINVDPILTSPSVLSLQFDSLNTSDAGRYTCDAVVTLSQINVESSSNNAEDLTLQIPTPIVTVARSQLNNTLLAGSELTICCDIEIDANVDTPFNVSVTGTMTDSNNNVETLEVTSGRVSVYSPYSTGFNQYQSCIDFSTLSSLVDSGVYTCDVVIDSNSEYTFVYDSDNNSGSTAIQVINPSIGNFAAFPNEFLGLETSCFDSYPFDDFTLNCSASIPAIVLPDLQLFWLHNGTLRSSNSITYNITIANELHKLTSLSFPTSTAADSGSYECVALLVIPDSDNITRMEESVVTIRPAKLPYPADDVSISVSTTTASITFTIPAIAYTPEQYYIEYIGLELQNQFTNSIVIMGVNNITAIDQEYTITLTGLEEDNSYNITVASVNCEGTTAETMDSFTTLPTKPTGPVLDCTNSTFHPRNVTLTWNPPLRQLQNGEIIGYQLFCQQQGSSVPVPDTNGTLSSPDTAYTIPVITPFRYYNCSLAAINNEGEGPLDFCQFYSAQDAPSDSPSNFTSAAKQFTVQFSWGPPQTPNGIITQYVLTLSIQEISTTGEMSNVYNTTEYTIEPDTFSRTFYNFSAYQSYNASITSRTIVGFGPEAVTNGVTQPDVSTPITLFFITVLDTLTLPAVNITTLNVTWRPPSMPNGYISSYNIAVTNRNSEPNQLISVTAVDGQRVYTRLVTSLNVGTPYYITIGAVNQLGQGENVSVTAFTGNRETTVPLVMNEPERSLDGTEITVSWAPVSLEDAGGFYSTSVTLDRASRKRQGSLTMSVPFNESSATFTGLEPSAVYSASAGVVVVGEDGNTVMGAVSEPMEILQNPGQAPTSPTNTTPIIIGAVVGVILLIAIVIVVIVVLILFCRRGKTGKAEFSSSKGRRNDLFELSTTNGASVLRTLDEPSDINDNMPVNGNTTAFAPLENEPDPVDDEEDPKKKLMEEDMAYLEAEKSIDRSKPIAKASFHEHVQQLHEDADKEYESEYKSVPMSTDSPIDSGKSETNKPKNRFANIFPYDFSRVQLPPLENVSESDYINASMVDGYSRKDSYVCAQGPLPTTIGDFWRMIYERKITSIVMLTGVIEGGKKKCEQYWPDNVGATMDLPGGLQVAMTSKVPFSDYTIHSLKVTTPGDKTAPALDVTHFHFTAWPDHGVPQFATSLIGFINRVQKSHDKTKGVPLLVHCSAGVGRTGTFVMLDSMIDRLRVEDSLNVYEFLRQMRSKRMFMVQTLTQYVFIHDALDEYITCGETDIPASNLKVRVSKMHKIQPSKSITGFQEQYQLLEQVCYVPNETAYTDAKKPFNTPKNRYQDVVPLNLNRPRLRPDGSEGSDYINSSCVDGYKQRNAYLVTQGPLKNTADDFWRLIVEFKSRNIVMLCKTIEEGQEKCFMYWPTKEGEPVEYGKNKVTLQSEMVNGDYIVRKILVQNEKSSSKTEREGVVITQFHYTQWSEHGHPTITGQIIEMVDILTRSQMNTGNKPITVVCNDGVGRSGAFLCIHSQLERLKTEGEVDVFKYLKSARTKRIGLVSEMDHYIFIHEVLADYVESFDPYANFKN